MRVAGASPGAAEGPDTEAAEAEIEHARDDPTEAAQPDGAVAMPVRPGMPAPRERADLAAPRFQVQSAAVVDGRTGLTWLRQAPTNDNWGRWEWAAADQYCRRLALSGMGWRLPTPDELKYLIDGPRTDPARAPALDPAVFTPGPEGPLSNQPFWASTKEAVSLQYGAVIGAASAFVRCVK